MRALRYTTDRSPKPRLTHPNQLGSRGSPLGRVLAGFVLASLTLCVFPENAQANICGRTGQVVLAILAEIPLSSCANVTSTHLASITGRMKIYSKSISSLKAGDFAGLSNLEKLNLYDNQLTTLPAGVFSGLSSLTHLGLSFNQLTTLSAGVFSGLSSLRDLNLNGNQLTTLPAGVFANVSSSLGSLLFISNQLTTLSAGAFANLSSLVNLSLDDNQLTDEGLPDGVFDDLSSLKALSLDDNQLTTLDTDWFSSLPSSVTQLNLSDNQITHEGLPAAVFSGFPDLWYLSFSDNPLGELPGDVFSGVPKIRWVYLWDIQVTTLPAGLFSGLTGLKSVVMGNPDGPFTFTMEPECPGANTFVVKVREGAYFDMTTGLRVSGGTLPGGGTSGTVTVAAGSTTSDPITVTPTGTDPVTVTLTGPAPPEPPFTRFSGMQIAVDGDPLTLIPPGLTVFPTSVNPGEDSSEDYTVKLNTEPSADVTITVERASGDTDLTVSAGASLTFTTTNWATPQTVTIAAADDNDAVDGTAIFTHAADSSDTDYDDITIDSVTATEDDDDTAPTTVNLTVSPETILEGAGETPVTVTGTWEGSIVSTTDTTVTLTLGGSASTATDYSTGGTLALTIPANQPSGATTGLTVTPTPDTIYEGNETITFTAGGTDITAGTPAMLTLEDDDAQPTTVNLTVTPATIGEGDGLKSVTVTGTWAGTTVLPDPTTVTLTLGGTAGGTDYSTGGTLALIIPALTASGATTGLTVTPTPDTIDEGNETITFTVTAGGGITAGTSATLTLEDDDVLSTTVNLTVSPATIGEGDGLKSVTVTGTWAGTTVLPDPTTVTLTLGGTAGGTDYSTGGTLALIIPALTASGATTGLTVTPTQDTIDEGNETITFTAGGTGVTAGTSATLTLEDDDVLSTTVNLTVSPETIHEGDELTNVTVTGTWANNTALSTDTTVTLTLGGSASTATDYSTGGTLALIIPANQSSGATTGLTVTPTQDTIDEGNETITFTAGGTGVTAGTSATLTLEDDDVLSTTVNLTVSPETIHEGDEPTNVTVTGTWASNTALSTDTTVTLTLGGSASTATDYSTGGTLALIIPANQSSGATTGLTVTPTPDTIDEGNETITFTAGGTGVTAGTPATLTLEDDDTQPATVNLTVSPATIGEGDGLKSVTVTGTWEGSIVSSTDTTVTLTLGGTAGGMDYSTGGTLELIIPANQSSGATTGLTVTPTPDTIYEGNETLTFTAGGTGITAGTPATLTLEDDDAQPTTVNLTVSPATIGEGDGLKSVTVTGTWEGSIVSSTDTTVTLTLGGTAGGMDYSTGGTLALIIPANQSSGATTGLTVTPTQDNVYEGNETLTFTAGGTGITAGTPATLTLEDDDAQPTTVNLTVSPATIGEGDGLKSVTVTGTWEGSIVSSTDTTVTLTLGGSASTATDYSTGGTLALIIPANQSSGATTGLTVTPTQDNVYEGNETLTFTAGGTGITAGTPATLTLEDDDAQPTTVNLTVSPATIGEGDGLKSVTVTGTWEGSIVSSTDTTVTLTLGGTAGGMDYSTGGTLALIIPANQSSGATTGLTVTPTQDNVYEGNETLTFTAGGTGITAGTPATLDIIDDDTVGVTVDPTDGLTTTEAGGRDSFTVVLESQPTAAVSIALSSSDPSEGTVVLENQPTGAGTLGLSSLGTSGGAVVSASFTFTLTPDDWDKPHTVIVTGMDDHEVDGPQSYTIEFAKTISDDPNYNGFQPDDVKLTNMDDEGAAIRARFRRLNDEILSKQALTLADVTIAAVTSRQEAGACADQPNTVSLGGQSSLAEALVANVQTLTTGSLNLKQLLGTSSFRLRLTEDGSSASPGCLTLWGQGDYRNLSSGDSQALDWDGDLVTGQVGADALLRPDLRAGLAVSWSDGDFDYTDRTDGDPFSGDYTSRMMSVHPYLTWWSPAGLDVWATGGYGQGEIEIKDEEAGTHTSDTTLRLGSVGASGLLPIGDALIAGGTTTLRVKAQASVAQMDVAGHGSLLQEQTIEAQRLRLALEGSHERPLASGGSLTPSLEVGLRHDGGDGATGTGLELGGGLRYVDPALGLTLEGRGRVLAAYDDAYKEWGASGLIRLDPGAAGQGLSLSLAPSYGQTASGVQRLWDQGLPQGPTQGPSPTQALTGRLEAEVGYGLAAFAGQGLVTPYGQLSLGGGTQQYRVGSRLELGPALRLSLEGTRQVTAVGQADHGIRLQVGWRF